MRINFRQGIVTYPSSGNAQTFLAKSGSYINQAVSTAPVVMAFAHRDADYLVTESVNVANAWGPLSNGVDYWLYWDINLKTGVRTFGFTTVEPVYSPTQVSGVPDQHWFNTSTGIMYVFTNGQYRECIRLFAAKFNTNTFYPLGVGFPMQPYAGSQVGITTPTAAGQIITDSTGTPIRQSNGTFFTTETDFFVDGSVINPVRLDATVVTGQALETMAKFNVVKFSDFGMLNIATYDDLQTSTIAMLLDDLVWQEVGTVCLQGLIVNPAWNWTTVGAPLWVANNGVLTDIDPHVSNALTYPTAKPPIARVVAQTSVIFDQGLGGKGEQGAPGLSGGVSLANASTIGVTQLSVNPQDAGTPIAVGTNDPRVINAVQKTGGTMTGTLVLNADPATALAAATKQYVDTAVAGASSVGAVQKTGDTMTGLLILSANPSAALGAATKQYVDTAVAGASFDTSGLVSKSGATMTGLLVLSGNPATNLGAATKQYVDTAVAGVPTNVVSVVAGSNVSVDNTDPHHPVVSASSGSVNPPAYNAQTGTTYTLALTDAPATSGSQGIVSMSNASPNVLTIPLHSVVAFPAGTVIQVQQLGTGQTSITGASGVSVHSAASLNARAQYSTLILTYDGSDVWIVSGDMT